MIDKFLIWLVTVSAFVLTLCLGGLVMGQQVSVWLIVTCAFALLIAALTFLTRSEK